MPGEEHTAGSGDAGPPPDGTAEGSDDGVEGRRLRFVDVELERLPSSAIRIGVTLADRGEEYVGEAEGVGGRVVELRLAAEATLEAVGVAVEPSNQMRLVGLKEVHAFDADLVLVAVRPDSGPGHRLVGAVPVTDDAWSAAVKATLDAVNRILGRELAPD